MSVRSPCTSDMLSSRIQTRIKSHSRSCARSTRCIVPPHLTFMMAANTATRVLAGLSRYAGDEWQIQVGCSYVFFDCTDFLYTRSFSTIYFYDMILFCIQQFSFQLQMCLIKCDDVFGISKHRRMFPACVRPCTAVSVRSVWLWQNSVVFTSHENRLFCRFSRFHYQVALPVQWCHGFTTTNPTLRTSPTL